MRSKTSGERRRMMRRYVDREELWCRCCGRPMWFRGLEIRKTRPIQKPPGGTNDRI